MKYLLVCMLCMLCMLCILCIFGFCSGCENNEQCLDCDSVHPYWEDEIGKPDSGTHL